MLNEIHDLPDGVIGFEVTGKLEASDYRDTLAPALQKAAAEEGGIRIVIVIPSFDGITPSAVWEDTKIGIQNWGAWKRAAVVTDADWMAHAVKWFGWLSPGELKHFATADRQAAIDWAAG
jgi:hypothetical protein